MSVSLSEARGRLSVCACWSAADLVSRSHRGSLGLTTLVLGPHLARVGRQELSDVGGGWRACQSGGREESGDSACVVDPLMHHNVIDCRSLCGIVVQDLSDEVTGWVRDSNVLWEAVSVHSDSLVGRLDILSFERRLSDNQSVNNDANRPDVDLIRVTLLALKNLRSNIVGSTANGTLALSVELKLRSKTEISDLDLHLVVKEEVTELEISMNDAMAV